jgi:Flp pilus assembly protein TadD
VATLMDGKLDQARALARQSETQYGSSAALDQIRGDIAFFEEQPDQALQFYRKSLEKNPKQAEIQNRVKDLEEFLSTAQ